MNRQQLHFPPSQRNVKYLPNPQLIDNYSDNGIPVRNVEARKPNQSELIVFNGAPQERPIYPFNQIQKRSLSPQSIQKVTKSGSQKALPIIYNAYNNNSHDSRIPSRDLRRQPNSTKKHAEQFMESNYSDVKQYGIPFSQNSYENQTEGNKIHTFNRLPEHPETAHFVQLPSDRSDSSKSQQITIAPQIVERNGYYQQQYLTVPDQRNFVVPDQRQFVVEQRNYVHQPPQIQQSSRPVSKPGSPISLPPTLPSPRNQYQSIPQNMPAFNQVPGSVKLIQIPQQEYQKFIDHLPGCKRNQDQLMKLKGRNQELGNKEHAYWDENMSLRQQNKRLKDLVNQFERREKELIQEREQMRESCLNHIDRYRQSALEEFSLLIERYRLELQKR